MKYILILLIGFMVLHNYSEIKGQSLNSKEGIYNIKKEIDIKYISKKNISYKKRIILYRRFREAYLEEDKLNIANNFDFLISFYTILIGKQSDKNIVFNKKTITIQRTLFYIYKNIYKTDIPLAVELYFIAGIFEDKAKECLNKWGTDYSDLKQSIITYYEKDTLFIDSIISNEAKFLYNFLLKTDSPNKNKLKEELDFEKDSDFFISKYSGLSKYQLEVQLQKKTEYYNTVNDVLKQIFETYSFRLNIRNIDYNFMKDSVKGKSVFLNINYYLPDTIDSYINKSIDNIGICILGVFATYIEELSTYDELLVPDSLLLDYNINYNIFNFPNLKTRYEGEYGESLTGQSYNSSAFGYQRFNVKKGSYLTDEQYAFISLWQFMEIINEKYIKKSKIKINRSYYRNSLNIKIEFVNILEKQNFKIKLLEEALNNKTKK